MNTLPILHREPTPPAGGWNLTPVEIKSHRTYLPEVGERLNLQVLARVDAMYTIVDVSRLTNPGAVDVASQLRWVAVFGRSGLDRWRRTQRRNLLHALNATRDNRPVGEIPEYLQATDRLHTTLATMYSRLLDAIYQANATGVVASYWPSNTPPSIYTTWGR